MTNSDVRINYVAGTPLGVLLDAHAEGLEVAALAGKLGVTPEMT